MLRNLGSCSLAIIQNIPINHVEHNICNETNTPNLNFSNSIPFVGKNKVYL